MLVRQEDVTQSGQGHVGEDELSRDAIAAIDDIRSVVADDHLGGRRAALSWARAAAGPQENESGPCGLRFTHARTGPRGGSHKCSGGSEKSPPVHIPLHAD
jgi:hypothetical protein